MNKQDKPSFESSLKSIDTEEFIDIHFYRPMGYQWALFFHKMGITPNQITFAAIVIGMAAGICFYFTNIGVTLFGILLLIWANSYDSADGQLARMTNQKSEFGRILDGACGDFWFASIYIAITCRLWGEWDFWILVLALLSGYFHAKQAAMADYYRNIHLLFLKGKKGSELDNSKNLYKKLTAISWRKRPFIKFFEGMYYVYTQGQEMWTPDLQKLLYVITRKYEQSAVPEYFREAFLKKSLPLMKYTNMLSFNLRSIVLFISLLCGFPWLYFIFELTVMNLILLYMVKKHEWICRQFISSFKPFSLTENAKLETPRESLKTETATQSFNLKQVKGIIFDYGGTIDTNGKHWGETLWEAYQDNKVPITKEAFREAYASSERYLATHPIIQPEDNFKIVLEKKIKLQINWLTDNGFLPNDHNSFDYSLAVSNQCYNFVRSILKNVSPILEKLKDKYPVALVSNFYGNIETVLSDFDLRDYFEKIIESAKVNVRKPNPAIFELGVRALGIEPQDTVVIGDSYTKDIVPAQKIGCQTIWLKGQGWEAEKQDQNADLIIENFEELKEIFCIDN